MALTFHGLVSGSFCKDFYKVSIEYSSKHFDQDLTINRN